nr:reverse transcriptase domain-containing protein [Tanacetum cinerariifolium]
MADNRIMAEMLRAPTEGCAEAIVVPPILAEQFELKHSLINIMTSEQFFGLETDNPHDHIRAARRWLEKEPPFSITTWDDLAWERYKDLLRACPHHGFTELHQLGIFYNALNPADQDSLNAAAGGNLLEKSPQDALTIIKNKSKVCNSRRKPIASPVKACDINSSSEIAKLTHAVNQQTSACLATGGNTFLEFRDNIQGYVSAVASNYNQGFNRSTNFNQEQPYQATTQPNQNFHLNELEKIKRMNDVSMKSMQNQIDMVKLRNEMKTSIQTSLSNQTNEIKNMMANLLQMNTASTSGSGSLPSNTIANLKGELKDITTRSGLVTDGPTVPTPPKSITPEVGERVEETYTDPDLAEYTIKVPPPPVQKYNPPSQRDFVVHKRDSPLPNIPYPLRMLKQKQQEKDELPEKLGDVGKSLIPCGFSELKCKALADLGASINLMPLSVWKELGLPDLIPTRMTLELANRAICTPDGIARDVFVPVGKFTFPADFVVVDNESDPRVPFILGRPFLRTARALIDVHGEEMILRDGDERLTLNMKHDTASYSNHPQRESVNLINIFNVSSEDFLEGCNVLSEILPDIASSSDIHPYFDDNPLSGSTTYSSNSLLEEFTDELARKDSGLKDSIDQTDLANLDDYFVDPIPEMFTNEHTPDYLSPSRFDVYEDDFLEVESDADNFYDDPFDSKGEKIKEFKLLIDELDLPCDFLPYSEYDSFNSHDFSRDDDLPSTNNEDKEKKLAISYASLVLEDFDPSFYEPLFFKDVPKSMMLLPFSFENEEKSFQTRDIHF